MSFVEARPQVTIKHQMISGPNNFIPDVWLKRSGDLVTENSEAIAARAVGDYTVQHAMIYDNGVCLPPTTLNVGIKNPGSSKQEGLSVTFGVTDNGDPGNPNAGKLLALVNKARDLQKIKTRLTTRQIFPTKDELEKVTFDPLTGKRISPARKLVWADNQALRAGKLSVEADKELAKLHEDIGLHLLYPPETPPQASLSNRLPGLDKRIAELETANINTEHSPVLPPDKTGSASADIAALSIIALNLLSHSFNRKNVNRMLTMASVISFLASACTTQHNPAGALVEVLKGNGSAESMQRAYREMHAVEFEDSQGLLNKGDLKIDAKKDNSNNDSYYMITLNKQVPFLTGFWQKRYYWEIKDILPGDYLVIQTLDINNNGIPDLVASITSISNFYSSKPEWHTIPLVVK